ncbi:MAG TPA: hypothetical protein PL037_10215, partial [Elusimicrobiales bacterium]|nr:hypothetical protein [Elusimicrobiales bacterium]
GRLQGIRIGRNWAIPVGALKAGGETGAAASERPLDRPRAERSEPPPEPAAENDPLDEMGWD